jgi:hypothetical protein
LTNAGSCAIIKVQKREELKAMKIFRTEMMNSASYGEYMRGGYNYTVMYYDVEAETREEAIAIAKKNNPSYHINTYAREVEKKEYITTEKDRLIARIAELEETLAAYKKDLENLEKGA